MFGFACQVLVPGTWYLVPGYVFLFKSPPLCFSAFLLSGARLVDGLVGWVVLVRGYVSGLVVGEGGIGWWMWVSEWPRF